MNTTPKVRFAQLVPLVLLVLAAACNEQITKPEPKISPKGGARMTIICDDPEGNPDCISNPDPNPPQPDLWYDPPMVVGEVTDITAQDDFVRVWMNSAEFRDTLPGVIIDGYAQGEQYCVTNGYVNQYNGQISPNCPTGPCYTQWKDNRNAQVAWSGMVNGFLLGALAVRHSWGLFTLSLPASSGAFLAWGKLDQARKDYIMCMSQDNNWNFYYPSPWNDPNPYSRPRYPNGMPR